MVSIKKLKLWFELSLFIMLVRRGFVRRTYIDWTLTLNLQFYNCKKRNYIYSKFENFDRLNLKDYDELCFVLIFKPHEQPCNRRLKGPTMRTD